MAPVGRPPLGKVRKVRFEDEDWDALGDMVTAAGVTDRGIVIRRLVARAKLQPELLQPLTGHAGGPPAVSRPRAPRASSAGALPVTGH